MNAVNVGDGVGLSSGGNDGVCGGGDDGVCDGGGDGVCGGVGMSHGADMRGVNIMATGIGACAGTEEEKCGVGLRGNR